jgi:hypothetical protein
MKLAKDDLIAALRVRYDYYSAQTMFELARTRAGLDEQHTYDVAEVRAFRAALTSVGDRVDGVQARLELLLGASPEAEPVQAKPEPAPTPAKPPAEAPAPPKPPAEAPPPAKPTKAAAGKPSEAQRSKEPQLIETTITLTAAELAKGEQMMMCGGSAELGDWDPEHAHPMTRDGGRWLAKLKLPPEAEVEFKFLRQAADGDVVWEDGEDRHLVAGLRLDATWR